VYSLKREVYGVIKAHFGARWTRQSGSSVAGKPLFNDSYIGHTEALRRMKTWVSEAEVISGLRNSGGFFSAFLQSKDLTWFSVDRVRSIPVFYAVDNGCLYVGDDPRWVEEQVQDGSFDEECVNEFLATGYVTGSDTLCRRVKQLQAGEVAFVKSAADRQVDLSVIPYYRFIRDPADRREDILLEALDECLVKVFSRLVEWAAGRTIVIPLSGGYDSRLIALTLRRLGYSDVVCYTYGRPRNWEAVVSREVARYLGYEWIFVPYRPRCWREWLSSRDMMAYYRFADGLSSLPHIQDWPAVADMRTNKRVADNSVFVPGHSADFLAGSHIPGRLLRLTKPGLDDVCEAVFSQHYCLTTSSNELQLERIRQRVEHLDMQTPAQAVAAFEYWDWMERQAKFICNSVRVYEFWGYEWALPFWEAQYMDFWSSIGVPQLENKHLYLSYVDSMFPSVPSLSPRKVSFLKLLDRLMDSVLGLESLELRAALESSLIKRCRGAKSVNQYLTALHIDRVVREAVI
jgi:asparagine synthase (glutamine-hydrolysing)